MSITYSNSKKNSRICSFASFILTFVIIGFVSIANANYTNLHKFVGGDDDGANPNGSSLTLSDDNSSFYGMTHSGGSVRDSKGVIFEMDIDGNNFTILHKFTGGDNDGMHPSGSSLTLSDGVLYGMTIYGGADDSGVIFKMDIDGNNYANLHDFDDYDDNNGQSPYGDLTLSDGVLYGMTRFGGSDSSRGGVIFKIETNGNNYANLHDFAGGNDDGQYPRGNLTLSGGVLYGMTYQGGSSGVGVIFKMETNGNNYANLHNFAGGDDDGKYPYGSLTLSGNVLYGMTQDGGSFNDGVIFKINTNGSDYTNLYDFTSSSDDGQNPYGSLIISGDSLAGMTQDGGSFNDGVIFRIGLDGNNYTNLHEFAGGADDGKNPQYGTLLECDGYFYGMTKEGGAFNMGVIFKQLVPEPTFLGILFILGGFFFRRRNT